MIVVWQSQWLGPVHSLVFVCVSGFGTALSFLLVFTCLAIAVGRRHHILGCARIKGERVQQASGCLRARHSHSKQQRLAHFHALSRHLCIASHTPSSSCRSWSTREHAPSRAPFSLGVEGRGGVDGWLWVRWEAMYKRAAVKTNREGGSPSRPIAPAHVPCGRQFLGYMYIGCGEDRYRPRSGGAQGAPFIPFRGFRPFSGQGVRLSLSLSPVRGRAHQGCAAGMYVGCGGHRLCGGSAAREGCAGLPAAWAKRLMWGFRDWGLGQPQIGLPQPRDNPCHGMAWCGLSPDGVLSLP